MFETLWYVKLLIVKPMMLTAMYGGRFKSTIGIKKQNEEKYIYHGRIAFLN